MKYINSIMEKDNTLRLYSVSHMHQFKKADCFVLTYNGEIWIVDGGPAGSTHALGFLLELRRSLLNKKEKHLFFDTELKLRINIFVSHFHSDHVEALIESVIPSPYIDVERVICAEPCISDCEFTKGLSNGDVFYREQMYAKLKSHHPRHTVTEIPFGKENTLRFSTLTDSENEAEFTVYPLPFSPAREDYLCRMLDFYSENGERLTKNSYIYVLNAASLWLHVRHGKNTFLLTGDSMKRRDDINDESLDIMYREYGEEIGELSVLKYVHHGYKRDPAAPIMASFKPKHLIDTCELATGGQKVKELFPDSEINCLNTALCGKLFRSLPDGTLTLENL